MDQVIQTIVPLLRRLEIPYVVIGGVASAIRGKPRTTADLDMVLLAPQKKVGTLLMALREAGFGVPSTAKATILSGRPRKLPLGKWSVDIRLASVELDRQAIRRAKNADIYHTRMKIASAEDVILYKLARLEDVDRSDIRGIITRTKGHLDKRYMKMQANRLAKELALPNIVENWQWVAGLLGQHAS